MRAWGRRSRLRTTGRPAPAAMPRPTTTAAATRRSSRCARRGCCGRPPQAPPVRRAGCQLACTAACVGQRGARKSRPVRRPQLSLCLPAWARVRSPGGRGARLLCVPRAHSSTGWPLLRVQVAAMRPCAKTRALPLTAFGFRAHKRPRKQVRCAFERCRLALLALPRRGRPWLLSGTWHGSWPVRKSHRHTYRGHAVFVAWRVTWARGADRRAPRGPGKAARKRAGCGSVRGASQRFACAAAHGAVARRGLASSRAFCLVGRSRVGGGALRWRAGRAGRRGGARGRRRRPGGVPPGRGGRRAGAGGRAAQHALPRRRARRAGRLPGGGRGGRRGAGLLQRARGVGVGYLAQGRVGGDRRRTPAHC
jgi:hypothetical protein